MYTAAAAVLAPVSVLMDDEAFTAFVDGTVAELADRLERKQ